ncbi:MAG: MotA/TolQ/ExbB proton channel family protein [Flavobacteriales bacterium]|nr:MotA/TolQ/ExbB proton channel family protein [Flavobacteriales bacterium]
MKNLKVVLMLMFVCVLGIQQFSYAQDDTTSQADTEMTTEVEVDDEPTPAPAADPEPQVVQDEKFHQVVKKKFIQGGPVFMSFVLICLVLGLAFCIERIIYLTMSTSNSKKLLSNVENALTSGGVEAAKEVCRNTSGPVASIFYQGLLRSKDNMNEGDLEMVEKSVIAYGSVQVGQLEKNISWISLFIALGPMLGFFGTVIGMIQAFDKIAEAKNVNAALVADGISVALITTVSGLLVAMILQVFYNFIIEKIDSISNDMENASISLVDLLVKHKMGSGVNLNK